MTQAAPERIDALDRATLERRIQEALYSSYWYAAAGCLVSLPLSRVVPPRLRYGPLAVLGVTGSLLDFAAGTRRAAPYRDRLLALEAEAAATASATTRAD